MSVAWSFAGYACSACGHHPPPGHMLVSDGRFFAGKSELRGAPSMSNLISVEL